MLAVIMAGGKGTRISSIAQEIPKPMIKIGGIPVLEHEIACLCNQGITEIIITVGHQKNVIMNYFDDGSGASPATGKPFGVHIRYFIEEEPLGNAGALLQMRDKLEDDFLLLNGDMMFDVDLERFIKFHHNHGGLVTLLAHPNDHPFDSGILVTGKDGMVLRWVAKEERRPPFYMNLVNAGIHIVSPRIFNIKMSGERVDLDRQVLKPLTGTGKMFAYKSSEYVKDMGTPERYEMVCSDFKNGIIKARSLRRRQRAIFLDRDGTINRYVGFLRRAEEFELLEGVAGAIRKMNRAGYLVIVVTNQPVIARGDVTSVELEEIHNKMETLLGAEGAYVDGIYYCPHHPRSGFDGERPELKIACECRKPKPGMLLKAAQDFNIDLSESWMIGDSKTDVLAGQAAGCKTVWTTSCHENIGQTLTSPSLGDAIVALMEMD